MDPVLVTPVLLVAVAVRAESVVRVLEPLVATVVKVWSHQLPVRLSRMAAAAAAASTAIQARVQHLRVGLVAAVLVARLMRLARADRAPTVLVVAAAAVRTPTMGPPQYLAVTVAMVS